MDVSEIVEDVLSPTLSCPLTSSYMSEWSVVLFRLAVVLLLFVHLSLGLGLGSLGLLLGLALELLLEGSKIASLLLVGLVSSVSLLGRGVDPLELDLLGGNTVGLSDDGLAESDGASHNTRDGTLDDEEVLTNDTIVGESTNGGDLLLGDVVLSGSVALVGSGSDAVDLLVGLSTVSITHLTSASDGEGNASRVPRANAGDLAETLVSLAGKATSTPTLGDSLETLTLGDGEDVDQLTLLEDGGHGDGLLEVLKSEVDLGGGVLASVDLDLHDVSLLLSNANLADLSVGNSAHHGGELADAVQIAVDGLLLGLGVVVLLGVLGEGLLLRTIPAAIETTKSLLTDVVGPDGGESTKTTGSLNVANKTDDDHGGSLDDGDGLANLLLVNLGASTIDLTNNVGAASLVAHEGSEVGRLSGVITGETSDTSAVVSAALTGQETQRTVARSLELTVRHGY